MVSSSKIYKTTSPEETERIGRELAKTLKSGDIITLDGDLGAGKTVFTRGVTSGLNIEAHVCSPTYTIVNEYIGKENSILPAVFHFDTYRLTGSDDFYDSGLEEYLYRDGICVIEWSSIIKEVLDELQERNIIRIEITGNGDDRTITIS
ncbi:MAG: tRNA (adenosine(37)-N6)-threonylcarbamoyltransferase complex ATPase subunit type 1 TsaE [Clostridia bacterium]|nr:tRNA (adenosine(37)-N6)-threonylcarbamoyltransferase complex ATPase subunit type 1 TsaE [Clostridia bacterium]